MKLSDVPLVRLLELVRNEYPKPGFDPGAELVRRVESVLAEAAELEAKHDTWIDVGRVRFLLEGGDQKAQNVVTLIADHVFVAGGGYLAGRCMFPTEGTATGKRCGEPASLHQR